MNISCKDMTKYIKKIIVLLVFTLLCTNILSYEDNLFIDYNRTLKDAPFSFQAGGKSDSEDDICTSEMLGKGMGVLVSNVLSNNINQKNDLRQQYNIVFLDMISPNNGSQFLCVEILTPYVHLQQMNVTEYIHKVDGKKREVL